MIVSDTGYTVDIVGGNIIAVTVTAAVAAADKLLARLSADWMAAEAIGKCATPQIS